MVEAQNAKPISPEDVFQNLVILINNLLVGELCIICWERIPRFGCCFIRILNLL